jgi:hypothetical protein
MGWWSKDILGGDTPLDYQEDILNIISGGYLTERDVTAEQFENMDEVFVNGKIDSIAQTKDEKSIAYQVLAVIGMRVGAKISIKLKTLMASHIRQDEWKNEDDDRRVVIGNLMDALYNYDGTAPVKINSKGLLEVYAEHKANGKTGLINK